MKNLLPILLAAAIACEKTEEPLTVGPVEQTPTEVIEVEVEKELECEASAANFVMYEYDYNEETELSTYAVDIELALCGVERGTFSKVALVADSMDNEIAYLESHFNTIEVVDTYVLPEGETSFQTGEFGVKQCEKQVDDDLNVYWDCWLVYVSNGIQISADFIK